MGDDTTQSGGGDGEPPREHPQDPAEGADDGGGNDTRRHSQDPAEGPDDDSSDGSTVSSTD